MLSLRYDLTTSEYGLNVLKISFENYEQIEVDLTDIYKDQSNLYTLYDQINEYVALLPRHTQKEIYDVFFKIHSDEYKHNYSEAQKVTKLELNIAKVSELLSYENFKIWLSQKEHLMVIPENIQIDYIHDPDMNTTEEKTYIRRDYVNLIALVIFIRALTPLYLDFYSYIKQITNHYYYKLFMLFVRADIYVSPEITKLKSYIEANQLTLIGDTKNEHLIVSAGLSDDDILDSLVSEIIFNKLLTIDFFHKKCNIISFIFQTIKYKGNFTTSDSVVIRSKKPPNEASKEDISYFEDYRKTSNVPIGTIIELQHAVSNIDFLVNALGNSNFDYDLYKQELNNINTLMSTRVDKIQIYLLGWFVSKIINPRTLYYLEFKEVARLLLFAKVVLLKNDQEFIGLLLGSCKAKEQNLINVIIKSNVNKALIKKLSTSYTFAMEDDKQSIIEKTIAETSKEISNCLWVPVGYTPETSKYVNKDGYLVIPNNINDIVRNFVEFVVTTN